jgi:hypothetical protein
MSRRPPCAAIARRLIDVGITLGAARPAAHTERAGRARIDAMNETTDCAWCELEIQGAEDWIRSDGRRFHTACFRSAQDYRRLTQSSQPPPAPPQG